MPARGAPRVMVAGELMLDVLIACGEGIFVRPGGSAANVAGALAGAGISSVVLGRVGPDPNGLWLADRLAGLACRPCLSTATGYVIIHRSQSVDRVSFVERGANWFFGLDDEDAGSRSDGPSDGLFDGVCWLHISGYCLIETGPAQAALRLAAEARRRRIPVSLDPGVPRAFRSLGRAATTHLCGLGLTGGPDVLLPSRSMAAFLEEPEASLVIVKDGPDGALVAGLRVALEPGAAVPGADISGAGDAFNGAYIAATVLGAEPAEAAGAGNGAASLYVREAVSSGSSPGNDWTKVARQEPPLLVSACLVGTASAYDGKTRETGLELGESRPDRRLCLPICPEQAGGLPTPRVPSEIRGGGGHDVLSGRATVVDRDGREVTESFARGTRKAIQLARAVGAGRALLKNGSPSCGVDTIHDGTFSGTVTPGRGVTASALERLGLELEPDEA